MREWLRGGVQPCQGWGRGFESRLALYWKPECVSIPVLRCGKIDEKEILFLKLKNIAF